MDKTCHHHNCLEELRGDHEEILAWLDKLEEVIKKPRVNLKKVREFLKFTENFAEPHHQKEEEVLFPAIEKKGIPRQGGPIEVMLMEHTAKREQVKNLKKALEEKNVPGMKAASHQIISILRDHIAKEDNILYPMAENVLTEEDLKELGQKCQEIKNKQ